MRAAHSTDRPKPLRYTLLQGKFYNIVNYIAIKNCRLKAGLGEDAGGSVAFLVAFRSISLEALFRDSSGITSKF